MSDSARSVALLALSIALAGCDREAKGSIHVVSFPRGRLVVDGHVTDVATPVAAHRLRGGRHRISVASTEVRFEPQTVDVVPGRTTHLYFRARGPAESRSDEEVCRRGRPDHCLARIEDELRAGHVDGARRLTRLALDAHPDEDGYGMLLRPLIVRLGGDAGSEPAPDE